MALGTTPPSAARDAMRKGAELFQAILRCASRGLSRMDFLREVSQVLLKFCGCDAIEIRLNEGDLHYRWEATKRTQTAGRFELVRWIVDEDGRVFPLADEDTDLERLCGAVARQEHNADLPFFTRNGSVYIGDTWKPLRVDNPSGGEQATQTLCVGGHHRSLVVTRFNADEEIIGLLHVKCEQPNAFDSKAVESCETVAQALGLAVADWLAQAALRERIKELTCLYGIAQVVEQAGKDIGQKLQRIVTLLPSAWQYPDNAEARITLDDQSYATAGFRRTDHLQSADIIVQGKRRGAVEVVYLEQTSDLDAGVFLQEEKKLIEAVARELALFIERSDARIEKAALQAQLIHADRLATIGQLAAGVAHELNEPLGGILGFAQLAKKCPGLPAPADQDIEKIITASLYAREVIKKLMVFARQMPARKIQIDLNQLVEEGLYFLEARCAKSGIRVVRELAAGIPGIAADPAQIKQILVNLVVNAVQAMPDGGTLTVGTQTTGSCVVLSVKDTGTGISEEILDKVFLPFFTTKDVDEGTGLGLAVVHGIVESHGGSIEITTRAGGGARFDVRLPITASEGSEEAAQDGPRPWK